MATIPAAGEALFAVVSDSVIGLPMHWFQEQSYPHRLPVASCLACAERVSHRWEGFVGVVDYYRGTRYILRVPAGAFRNCADLADLSRRYHLRGHLLRAFRIGQRPSKKAAARIIVERPPTKYTAPPAFDLPAALCRYWRIPSLESLNLDPLYVLNELYAEEGGNP